MDIKVGHRHVDREGLVYLPFLHEWNARTHNLMGLCAAMSSVFGMDPPVYAIKKPSAGSVSPTPPSFSTSLYPGRYPPVQQPPQQPPPPPSYESVAAPGGGGGGELQKQQEQLQAHAR